MENTKVKKILGIAVNVIVWAFVAISLLTTVLVFAAQGSRDGVPSVFGVSLITITTESMEDTYKPGDLVFMKKITDAEKLELREGEIITFRAPIDIDKDGKTGDLNTHRVYKVTEGSLSVVTKGDNNLIPDNEGDTPYTVHHSDIIGKCTEDGKLRGVGSVINFLRSSLGFFLCIILPLILFFLYELYNFINVIVKEKAAKAAAGVASADEEEIKRRAIEEYLKNEEEIKRRAIEEYLAKTQGAAEPEKKADGAESETKADSTKPEDNGEGTEL